MTDHPGFLQAICEQPDDDVPRLVYADWLEEQGDSDRGQFIRAQCYLARFRGDVGDAFESGMPAGELLPPYRQAFLAPLLALGFQECVSRYHDGPGSGFAFYFRRGFVEGLEVFGASAAARLVEQADNLFRLTPLRHLRFQHNPLEFENYDAIDQPTLEALVRLPQVGRLRSLDLRGLGLDERAAQALLDSPHLSPRTLLFLDRNRFGRHASLALRARWGAAVTLEGCGVGPYPPGAVAPYTPPNDEGDEMADIWG